MPVIGSNRDRDECTFTIAAVYDEPVERIWQLWADPRQLERWWGPPSYPATFEQHDLTPGSLVTYFMTGPQGDQPRGWWKVLEVDAPNSLLIDDGFGSDPQSAPPELPVMRMRMSLTNRENGGTAMQLVTTFPSSQALDQVLDMGMEEGITLAMSQIDDVLSN